MAEVDKVEKMRAIAAGGPPAGAEYEQAQRAVVDLKQQALSDAANRAGAINAPQAFVNAQSEALSVPLDAQAQSLGAQAAAAGQYGGSMNAAQGAYASQLNAARGLIQERLQKQAALDDTEQLTKLSAVKEKQDAQAAKDAEKDAKAREKIVAEEAKGAAEQAKRLAVTGDMSQDTLDTFEDIVKDYKDWGNASQVLEALAAKADAGELTDDEGNPLDIDFNVLTLHTMKALNPELYAEQYPDGVWGK